MGTALTVTADDYGLTGATSRAILDAHRHGIVTATSVLAVAPGVRDRLGWLDDAPELSVGVHLAVVGEDPPLLSAKEVPTLVDRTGAFARSWRPFLARCAAGRIDPADLRRELDAQIELVAGGRTVTHLDTHQHTHLWPTVGRVVLELARARGIERVRVPRSGRRTPAGAGIDRLARQLAAGVDAAGLQRTQRFRGLVEAGAWDQDRLLLALEELAAGDGSVEINAHPGAPDDPDRARYRWGYRWGSELAALRSEEVADAVARHGFDLVGR